ncbi:unnamed protein product [Danaus chrysippus]|uniref:(African queen) hypothetical protein n=1 Tax=Danaus chrysippus TaxID=151541 RepID=A0A8J2QMR6_9NEOP|nr:unnamed protein product [Danaus chrysippus]
MLPIVSIYCGHSDRNDTNVFIAYGSHSDAEAKVIPKPVTQTGSTKHEPITTVMYDEPVEDVVFVPNDKPVFRNGDVFDDVRISDVIDKTRTSDLMRNRNIQMADTGYSVVSMDYCKGIARRDSRAPMTMYMPGPKLKEKNIDTRRSIVSRRSLTKSVEGRNCDHECPVSCTDDYNPLCAINEVGARKVFLNHCQLDLNSCSHKLVWHLRPLSECVGGRKADMTQNRGFIGWMQRVGIVDKKGKLVLT